MKSPGWLRRWSVRSFLLAGLLCVACGGDEGPGKVFVDIPVAEIVVDGSEADWIGIQPIATDRQGDDQSALPGADAKDLYLAQSQSGDTVFVMLTFWDGPPNTDLASGYSSDGDSEHPDVASGYQVFWGEAATHPDAELFARYDPDSSLWYEHVGIPWGIADATVAAANVLEFAFLSGAIGSPATTDCRAAVNASAFSARRDNIPDSEAWVRVRLRH